MYNPTPWQATSAINSPNPGDCEWDLKVKTSCTGRCHADVVNGELTIGETAFSTNYTMIPLGRNSIEKLKAQLSFQLSF